MTTDQKLPQQRTDPRYMARIAIFHGIYQDELLTDYSINISTGGVFIETGNILPVDTDLLVQFNLPNFDNLIVSKARVAWTNDPGALKKPLLPPGMGLQFIELSLEDMHTIRTFLDKTEFVATW